MQDFNALQNKVKELILFNKQLVSDLIEEKKKNLAISNKGIENDSQQPVETGKTEYDADNINGKLNKLTQELSGCLDLVEQLESID